MHELINSQYIYSGTFTECKATVDPAQFTISSLPKDRQPSDEW
jgi:hypothetical protein